MLATRINLHELQTINRFEQSMGVEGCIMEVKLLCAKVHTEGGGGGGNSEQHAWQYGNHVQDQLALRHVFQVWPPLYTVYDMPHACICMYRGYVQSIWQAILKLRTYN